MWMDYWIMYIGLCKIFINNYVGMWRNISTLYLLKLSTFILITTVYCTVCLISQKNTFKKSPVWVLMCTIRLSDRRKGLLHYLHVKGVSPVWVLMCFFRTCEYENDLLHSVHSNGFPPVWVLMCAFRWDDCMYDL
jgi:hypothetical protein